MRRRYFGSLVPGGAISVIGLDFNFLSFPTLAAQTGGVTFPCVRAGTNVRTFLDWELVPRMALANEAVLARFRRIENLLAATAALGTQSVTVKAEPHIVSFTGTGSIELSGVGAGTLTGQGASSRVALSFTPTAGSLTLTVTGSVTLAQLENIQSQSNTNPSEYVSSGTLATPYHGVGVDGVAYKITRNGNTVAAELVTEAAGTAIATSILRGLEIYGSRTNRCLQAENFGTTWAAIGTPTRSAAAAQCGCVKMDLLGDDDGAGLEGYSQTIPFATSNQVRPISLFFKKGTLSSNSVFSSVVRLVEDPGGTPREIMKAAITWPGPSETVANTGGSGYATAASASLTASITVPAGSTLLIAAVSYSNLAGGEVLVSSGSWNGAALTQATTAKGYAGAGDNGGTDIWFILSPDSGLHTLTMTMASAPDKGWVTWSTWTGHDMTTPLSAGGTTTAGTTTSSISCTLPTGSVAVDAIFSGFVSPAITPGDTLIYKSAAGARQGGGQYNNTDGIVNWSALRSGHHSQSAVVILANVGTPGAGTVPTITTTTGSKQTGTQAGIGYETCASSTFRLLTNSIAIDNTKTNVLYVYPSTNAALDVDTTGNIYVGGVQAEDMPNSSVSDGITPYIPTTTVAVNRPQDLVRITPISSWFNTAGGTFVASVIFDKSPSTGEDAYMWNLGDSAAGERILTPYRAGGKITLNMRADGNVEQVDTGSVGLTGTPVAANVVSKVSYGVVTNDAGGSFNGNIAFEATPPVVMALAAELDNLTLGGSDGVMINPLSGCIRSFTYYTPPKKTSAQLVTLATP